MKVVLSIKPEFAFKIFDGTKKFEFRKSIFKNEKIKTIIVYASSPVQQVIGEFEIEEVLNHDLSTLWDLTQEFSGISEEFYYEYFTNKEQGFAIKIKKTRKYRTPKCLRADFNLSPPQSFAYWTDK
ncbi:MAG: ASCH domain-containing protein [Cytophagales bacterium]|jgi:predicted transcriptional regulator|nr:ASCH domain-containing protein [Cytophagales bacterium]MCA6427579.1 ASCH domain-containing protein [Cytophagales bacterium]MCA6438170.1 ASCH domain-containing protein [Bacteroidota bacterium]MCA6443122.1 ASCH domain-containing protein [Bacteroidota bacterium]MCA6492334.1 ASCH domain-containing protein [Chitinophagaceae bacterium]